MKTMTKAMVTAMDTVTRTKHCNEAPPVQQDRGCFCLPVLAEHRLRFRWHICVT